MLQGERRTPEAVFGSAPKPSGETLRLVDLLDTALLQELQDSFSALGHLSIVVHDAAGQPITSPSCTAPLCQLIRAASGGRSACEASAATGVRTTDGRPAKLLKCHAGMRHQVAPIRVLGATVGSVLAGSSPAEPIADSELVALAARSGTDEQAVRRAAEDQGIEPSGTTPRFHELLAGIISTLCEQRYEIRRRIEELSTVCDLGGMLSGTGDLQEAMDATAARVCVMMGAKASLIRLVDGATGELVLRAAHNLSQEYLDKGSVTVAESPVDRSALSGEAVYIEDVPSDPRMRYPDQARQEGIISGLSVPVAYRGEALGVLRVYTGRKQRFTPFEEVLLRAIGSQIAAAVANSRLHEQRLAAERYYRHLHYAAEIQGRMIPPLPQHPRISFGTVYDPQLEVGGDFYDFIELPQGNLGVCIADVVGKGVPAALLMASVRASLRAHADATYNISGIIAKVNDRLFRDTLVSEFATLFYGVFRPDASQFTYCNAGHEPPLLLRGDKLMQLRTGGMVIGIDPKTEYAMDVVDLRPGDLLVMVTDGVTEALDFNDEPFGRERLHESIRRHRDLPASTCAQQLLWDVRRFVGLAPKTDDLTLVVAKVNAS